MTRLYANNFITTLNGGITAGATTITLTSVSGLPAIGSGDTCQLTMDDGTNIEVVTATALSGNDITVTRAQEGTSGFAFVDTDPIELRSTALSFIDPAGVIDFGGATSLEIPNDAAPTVNANGEIAVDNTVTDFSHGIVIYYSGEEMGVVAMPIAEFTTPTDGNVIAYNATNDEFELVAAGVGDMVLADVQTVTGAKTFDSTKMIFAGSTSGTITLNAEAIAGSNTIVLPAATDTLVGKATTDTFTNKTFDANATGNSLSNVDVADLANGTDGELITWSAAGVAAVVAVGTSTHVLTSNGPGVAPTFQAAAGSGTNTPYFSASNTVQSISASSETKLQFDTEDVDSDGDYDPTTNYRFTPSTAGDYVLTLSSGIASLTSTKAAYVAIKKNGSIYEATTQLTSGGTLNHDFATVTGVVAMNGSTDYLEAVIWHNDTVSRNSRAGHFAGFKLIG